jgi:uncharacterized membrane protein YagU involved in acid resistance
MAEHHELEILIFLASFIFLIAVYFSFKLSKETHHEKYWLSMAVGFLVFAIHHWMMIPLSFGLLPEAVERVIEQVSSIVGSILFAYATHGLYVSMKEINKKLK